MKLKPILRNEEGASPGGGADPSTPSAPTAQTAPPATPVIPVDAIKTAIAEALTTALPAAINGHFANARRNGDLKKDKTTEQPPTATAATPAAPSAGLSVADVEAMLERERVIATRAAKFDLNDNAVRRLKSALNGVDVSSLAAEADSFLADLGLAKAPTPQQATTAPGPQPQPSNAQPISDKGSPVPGGVTDWEREYAERPHAMSPAAISAMNAKHGTEKARRMRVERTMEMGAAIRLQTKP